MSGGGEVIDRVLTLVGNRVEGNVAKHFVRSFPRHKEPLTPPSPRQRPGRGGKKLGIRV